MKTTIKIHGRDVEFTDEPPTRAGARWLFCGVNEEPPALVSLFLDGQGDLRTMLGLTYGFTVKQHIQLGHMFSAPLVPVTEVELAHVEGIYHGSHPGSGCWATSRARRVVEGLE